MKSIEVYQTLDNSWVAVVSFFLREEDIPFYEIELDGYDSEEEAYGDAESFDL